MKFFHSLLLALSIAAIGSPAWTAQQDQHKGLHPAGATPPHASKSMPGKASPDMARMDTQMKAMREMHDKMMAAKTLEERNDLMAEHMKTIQDGMAMLNGMPPGGMGGMKGEMPAHHQTMAKQMEMMQSMMQMMMDRLPAAPAK